MSATQQHDNKDWYNEEKEVIVSATWNKTLDYYNHNDFTAHMNTKCTSGLRNDSSEQQIVEASHDFGVTNTIRAGTKFKVVSLSNRTDRANNTSQVTMTQSEIHDITTFSLDIEIPPKTRLIKWQLVVDVGGHDIGCAHFVDSINDERCPTSEEICIKVKTRRQITVGTKFRLQHASKGLFINVVVRKNWPAATLTPNSDFYFSFHSERQDYDGYRIVTHNSTHAEYDAMYSANAGGIYFNQHEDEPSQFWKPIKCLPLYFGDKVMLMNANWPTAGLCFHKGQHTDVYCLYDQHDEWILF